MGIYTEKRAQLIEKIKGLEKRIASDTAKKKTLGDKLKEVSRLAENEKTDTADLPADFGQQMSFTDKANPYED